MTIINGPDDDFRPVQIVTVDIGDPVPAVPALISRDGAPYTRARILVLLHDIPVGIVWIDQSAGGIAAADLAGVIADSLGSSIIAHLRDDAVRPVRVDTSALMAGIGGTCSRSGERVVAPLVSVVLATRGRPASLPHTLDSLLRSDHPNFEIVVVGEHDDIATRGQQPPVAGVRQTGAGFGNQPDPRLVRVPLGQQLRGTRAVSYTHLTLPTILRV